MLKGLESTWNKYVFANKKFTGRIIVCHIPHLGDFHVIESDSNDPASSLTSGEPCSPFQCLGRQRSSCLGGTTYQSDLWDFRFISHHHYQNTDYLNLALKTKNYYIYLTSSEN